MPRFLRCLRFRRFRHRARLERGLARRSEAGFTLPEMLAVVAILGLATLASAAAFSNFMRRSESMMAARLSQKYLYQARMLAVYRGVNHFVVIDPTLKTISLYEDSTSPFSKFNTGDGRVEFEPWPQSVSLALPPATASLPDPLGGAAITNAWSLPLPDTSGAWGTTLRGVMTTPQGAIDSAESTPQVVNSGVMVFADGTGQTTSVGIRGQMGSIKSYRYDGSAWQVM